MPRKGSERVFTVKEVSDAMVELRREFGGIVERLECEYEKRLRGNAGEVETVTE